MITLVHLQKVGVFRENEYVPRAGVRRDVGRIAGTGTQHVDDVFAVMAPGFDVGDHLAVEVLLAKHVEGERGRYPLVSKASGSVVRSRWVSTSSSRRFRTSDISLGCSW